MGGWFSSVEEPMPNVVDVGGGVNGGMRDSVEGRTSSWRTTEFWNERRHEAKFLRRHEAKFIKVSEGVSLPTDHVVVAEPPSLGPTLVIAHGLGSRNPRRRNRYNDPNVQMIVRAVEMANDNKGAGHGAIVYDARGHGHSRGWDKVLQASPGEGMPEQQIDLGQFHWASLSKDMLAIAAGYDLSEFVAAGNSMGAASALYAATQDPEKVRGLVLVRVPTMWKTRKARQGHLAKAAERLQQEEAKKGKENSPYPAVLFGAAKTDLPDKETLGKVRCPVLIIATHGDAAHPLDSALWVHEAIPHSTLYIVPEALTQADGSGPVDSNGMSEWQHHCVAVIANWLVSHIPGERTVDNSSEL
eukprot:g42901.t1